MRAEEPVELPDGSLLLPARYVLALWRQWAHGRHSAEARAVRDAVMVAAALVEARAGRDNKIGTSALPNGTSAHVPGAVSGTVQGMSTKQAARAIGTSERNVIALATRGRLAGSKVRGRWEIEPESVRQYAQERSA